MESNRFLIIGHTYDINSKDLRIVGKNNYSTVEVIVHDPAEDLLTNIINTYDLHSPKLETSLVLTGAYLTTSDPKTRNVYYN